ncbi:hypothetical protein PR202_ga31466 [Eleusine coracana subsp. coracana]|uniref:Uncharacterized protein n=1 Tax=Eleusine coracana subsp. coracana TaxID=191504 RepID=A0AAV5DS57_ELECO|nr:hypothetical protein PR202_ga31466 [Eleusine coracana subsp. coracana]
MVNIWKGLYTKFSSNSSQGRCTPSEHSEAEASYGHAPSYHKESMSISEAAKVASEQGGGDGEFEKFMHSKENMVFNDFDEQSKFTAIQDWEFTSVRKFDHDFLE